MTADTEQLLDELLQLPQDERAAIATILADSIQHQATSDIEASWIAEAKGRLESVRAGESTTIPTEVVEDELDAIVTRASQATRATG
ncbi:addiction module protein [Paraliomyxa miuraensis]|uniref:addiction module protein n=1 Tax=Paraliomyxa miuraensis TaxID=376150 RepID=UPI0022506B4F|nr:addiction module protein [Paraliomyxa miuraensis]MCX4239246.1 addiction module protein [Paraliomyxa miuraensis]